MRQGEGKEGASKSAGRAITGEWKKQAKQAGRKANGATGQSG